MSYEDTVAVLVDCLNQRNVEGQTPLHLAVEVGSWGMVKSLLKIHARMDIKDNEGRTPLALALQLGNADIIGMLKKEAENRVGGTSRLLTYL